MQPYFPDNYTTKSQPFAVIIPQSNGLLGKHQSIIPECQGNNLMQVSHQRVQILKVEAIGSCSCDNDMI